MAVFDRKSLDRLRNIALKNGWDLSIIDIQEIAEDTLRYFDAVLKFHESSQVNTKTKNHQDNIHINDSRK